MAITPLSLKITADLSGLTSSLNSAMGQLRGIGQQVSQSFSGVTTQTTASTTAISGGIGTLMNRLGGLAAAYGALRSVQTFARMADEAALATARIEGLTGSMAETREAQAGLFEIAQRLQAGYGEAVASFSRMLPAVKELGGGVRETTSLTEILLTTAKLSGASAAEASASATQFAQALGSGALQGDELRSILENNNTLARTLAEGLGVSIGELRRMGEEGKLTSDLVANTLLGAYDDIKSKAAELPQTVGGAWTQITNAFTLLVTSVSNGTGIFTTLATVMGEVAKVIELVARTLFSAGEQSDALKDRKGAAEFAQSVGRAFAYMADLVTSVVRSVVDIVGALLAVFRAAGNQIGAVGAAIASVLRGDFAGAAAVLRDAGEVGAAAVNRLGTAVGESAARMVQAWNGAGAAYQGYVASLAAGAGAAAESGGGGQLAGGAGGGAGAKPTADKATARGLEDDVDAINAAIEAERRRFAIAQEVATIRTQMDRDRALAAIEAEQRVTRFQLDNQQITEEQYLAAEQIFEDRKYEIRRAAADRALELAKAEGRDPAEVEAINAQLLQLELDYQTRKQEIALQVQQAAAGSGAGGAGRNVYQTMQQSMSTALEQMLTRAKSFGQAMSGVYASMRSAIIGEIAKILMAKIAAFAKEKMLALAHISANAATAGSGAASSVASIPYVGPILAIAAMAAVLGSVMALGGGIKSAAGGFSIPSGLNPVTQLHQEEMVLPADIANPLRQNLAGGGGGVVNVEVQGASVGDFLLLHKSELVRALKSARRDLAF